MTSRLHTNKSDLYRSSDRAATRSQHEPEKPIQPETPLSPEDFYYEGPYMVFTEAYHRRRGYCCNSGCRHCPFR
jgi:hypothetical protein